MLVPVVVAASTSPSPANVPPMTDTVADDICVESGSLTVMLGDSVAAAPSSVHAALAATLLKVGGRSAGTTVTVSVAAVLVAFDASPSLSTQVTVRTPVLAAAKVTR